MPDVLGQALFDFYHHLPLSKLWIHNKYGRKEEMPVSHYFRKEEDMPELELIALQECRGKVLDIGAGAGCHSLPLQLAGLDVTALEVSAKAAEVMKLRGVTKIVQEDIFQFTSDGFDTLLLLMNGIGLTGNIDGFTQFLQHAKTLLNAGGQLLFDSSDVAYLYDNKVFAMENYYGEIMYRYEYKKQKTDWFTWLYIDRHTLRQIAEKEGWQTEILCEDEYDQYLAKLTPKPLKGL